MLVADGTTSNEFVGVRATHYTYTEIAMMVTPPGDTRLVGNTQQPCAVVLPETLLGDMTGNGVVIILDIAVGEILPRIVVLGLMLIGQRDIKATLVEGTESRLKVVLVALGLGRLCISTAQQHGADSDSMG